MIRNFKPRLYQETILGTAAKSNTLVVLPTGMGKTSIALMLAAHRLRLYPSSKILVLAPTKPLVQQLMDVFKRHIEIEESKIIMFTGLVTPEKRKELWKEATIISSTPQGLENDILSNRISLEDVSLLVFDEAHRAVKDYSYVWIAKQYLKKAKYPRILALTASPGSEAERITEVCQNLGIEEVEIRSEKDPDVKPYVQEIKFEFIGVLLPEKFREIKKFLEDCFKSKLKEVKEKGFMNSIQHITKKELLGIQAELHSQLAHGIKDFEMMKAISLLAEAMKVQHALELLETQGITALKKYFEKLMAQAASTKVKAVQNLAKDINFRSAMIKAEKLFEEGIEHPKMEKLREILSDETGKNPEIKTIIFNQYRDNALMILRDIEKIPGITARLFVGQAKKGETGMSQKEQLRILDEFRENKFNTVVMTSVGEEGLDIPKVDMVVFYEPIPSAIRHIQRKGRTGRLEKGRVIILMAKGTRDEAYRWTAYHKEKRMHSILSNLKTKVDSALRKKPKENLGKFIEAEEDAVIVFADAREKASPVLKELVELGAKINITNLESSDYILSSRVALEYKTVPDFVDSIIDGRLLQQLRTMKQSFERPLVVVEGTEDIYSMRNIHPNAIRGMLATIAVSFSVPIIQTKNPKETASLLHIIARREQDEVGRDFSPHGRKPLTIKEQQEYIVSSFPGIGGTLSKPLLRKFRTVKNIVNAEEKELKEVELIGEKKARTLRELFDEKYEL